MKGVNICYEENFRKYYEQIQEQFLFKNLCAHFASRSGDIGIHDVQHILIQQELRSAFKKQLSRKIRIHMHSKRNIASEYYNNDRNAVR